MWQRFNEELFDYRYLINNYRNMSLNEFMIAVELSIRKRYGRVSNVVDELPQAVIDRIFYTNYCDVVYKNQYAFLHSAYIHILLDLSRKNRVPKNILSPYCAFIINRTQLASTVAGEIDAMIYSDYYQDIYSNIDFDVANWNSANKGDYETNVLESIINFYINEMHTYLDNLEFIFVKTPKGNDIKEGAINYRNLVRMIIPRIAESVVIAFTEIISDADFAELNAISNYNNRYGMNRNELFDKVIDRMLNSFNIKG